MKLYLKDGSEIELDHVDAKEYLSAGLATKEKPSEQAEQEIEVEKPKRGRPAKDKE
jgi:hypothetical protein